MQQALKPILPANPSELPDGWIDRLFLRLHTMYGKAWLDLWADAPIPAVKAQWTASLERFGGEAIRQALAELEKRGKTFPPTLPELAGLCEQFRPQRYVVSLENKRRPPIPQHVADTFARIKADAEIAAKGKPRVGPDLPGVHVPIDVLEAHFIHSQIARQS